MNLSPVTDTQAWGEDLLRKLVAASPELTETAARMLNGARKIADDFRDDPAVGVLRIRQLLTNEEDHYHG